MKYNSILMDLVSEETKAELDKEIREAIQAEEELNAYRLGLVSL